MAFYTEFPVGRFVLLVRNDRLGQAVITDWQCVCAAVAIAFRPGEIQIVVVIERVRRVEFENRSSITLRRR